ncbi:hypothetical protein IGI04_007909 [Brassica rapa subsp. trilocularis]|uniref:Uncharacterized protein n=1 Tax=Brassica rapa subsp. trilocularis TaxID=1813537 RepID=A0ABQ7NL37_BRACM|nr:hypothetical protein IGI04_007909 [Brassica rapa subsp. trilocularis]
MILVLFVIDKAIDFTHQPFSADPTGLSFLQLWQKQTCQCCQSMNGIQVLKKVKEKHDRGEQHIPDDHDLDDEDAEEYDVGQIDQQGHGGAPGKAFHVMETSHTKVSEPIKAVEPVRGPNTSHGHEALPHHARPLEDVTRTFVPGEQLRVNIERDRGMEEGMAAQVFVGCRIIIPNWWRSWSSTALAKRKGTCDDVQLLLEERGDTIQEEPTQARLLQGYYVY